jgi:hypothetical protein
MSPADLMDALVKKWPLNATCWSQATDEIRDMSREAREMIGYSELHAINFRACNTPSEWNTNGIHSIVRFYKIMDHDQRARFIKDYGSLLT